VQRLAILDDRHGNPVSMQSAILHDEHRFPLGPGRSQSAADVRAGLGNRVYPKFLPWCDRARVSERGQNRTVATLRITFRGLKEEFTTENHDRPHDAST